MVISSTLRELNGLDYTIRSFDGATLEIVGGVDGSIHTSPSCILIFSEVSYIDCPSDFLHTSIRLSDLPERSSLSNRVHIDDDDIVYTLVAETSAGLNPHSFFIVADSVDVQLL